MQVGTTVIALEYRRTDVKDRDKRAKEDAYRRRVEDEISDERRVCLVGNMRALCMSAHVRLHCSEPLSNRSSRLTLEYAIWLSVRVLGERTPHRFDADNIDAL